MKIILLLDNTHTEPGKSASEIEVPRTCATRKTEEGFSGSNIQTVNDGNWFLQFVSGDPLGLPISLCLEAATI